MREPLYVIFDGPPSHESGRFVEVETADGKSVNAGTWENHSGKYWRLGPLYREPQASRLETGAMTDCCGGNCLMRCPPAAPAATPNEAVPKSELERLMSEKMEWAAERDRKDATIADLRGKLEQAQAKAEEYSRDLDDALVLSINWNKRANAAEAKLATARADERERCAKVLEARAESVEGPTNAYAVGELYEAALAIRALKEASNG